MKKVEFEEALVSLTQECDFDENTLSENTSSNTADSVFDTAENFVTSNSRAAQLEAENRDFRIKLATLGTLIQEFCSQTKSDSEKDFNFYEAVTHLENSFLLLQRDTVPTSSDSTPESQQHRDHS